MEEGIHFEDIGITKHNIDYVGMTYILYITKADIVQPLKKDPRFAGQRNKVYL